MNGLRMNRYYHLQIMLMVFFQLVAASCDSYENNKKEYTYKIIYSGNKSICDFVKKNISYDYGISRVSNIEWDIDPNNKNFKHTIIDIDNDGTDEYVLSFEFGLDDGSVGNNIYIYKRLHNKDEFANKVIPKPDGSIALKGKTYCLNKDKLKSSGENIENYSENYCLGPEYIVDPFIFKTTKFVLVIDKSKFNQNKWAVVTKYKSGNLENKDRKKNTGKTNIKYNDICYLLKNNSGER